jgi:hypothetical protein
MGRVGKGLFIEGDMTRDYDFASLEIKTAITAMLRGISEKYTLGGTRREFVFGCREGVDITETAKDT